ncbi:adenylate kinase family protein [Streptomyces wuyuanensis]|uniref:adenylate kinase family protein n=1 Tax=Streptomyces wuyuanensis TaxID=1196353 RepID=UPI00371A7297
MPNKISLKVVLITGPPGAGKSTALHTLDREHPYMARFSVRDYGLRLAAAGDPLGLAMRETLLRQEMLTDEVVLAEFNHFLDNLPNGVHVIAAEGYPRGPRQCDDVLRAVSARGARVTDFVVVDVPDSVARERVANRRLCGSCGATTNDPDSVACPDCGGAIMRRRDDEASKFEWRLVDYHEVSRELHPYFARRALLRKIDGTRSLNEVRELLHAVLSDKTDVELSDFNR